MIAITSLTETGVCIRSHVIFIRWIISGGLAQKSMHSLRAVVCVLWPRHSDFVIFVHQQILGNYKYYRCFQERLNSDIIQFSITHAQIQAISDDLFAIRAISCGQFFRTSQAKGLKCASKDPSVLLTHAMSSNFSGSITRVHDSTYSLRLVNILSDHQPFRFLKTPKGCSQRHVQILSRCNSQHG